LMASKRWARKHAEGGRPVSAQRWYCRCCGAGFKTKFGMRVETAYHTLSDWFSAELSVEGHQDIRN